MNRQQRRAQGRANKRAYRDDVAIGVLTGHVESQFYVSLVQLMAYDWRGTGDGRGGEGHFAVHIPMSAGANIVTARNLIVRQFLELPASVEWLWLLDDDMSFEPDTLERLLAVADRDERPIVGGLCFSIEKGEAQAITPTIYDMSSQGQLVRWHGYPDNELVRVVGTGAACLLVHRNVFQTMLDAEVDEALSQSTGVPVGTKRFPPPWPWFAETITGTDWGASTSEDLTFCLRAGACGFPVYVDTSVKIGHIKKVVVDEPMFRSNIPPPEEPAPTYVVIPVKGQQHYTTALLKQLDEQGGYEQVFVYDNAAGTDEALAQPDGENVTVIPAAGKTIHEMWNLGIKEARNRSPRCNVAILNNDIEIGANFLAEMAAGLRAHPSIACVGGNYDGRTFVEKVQEVKGICAGRYDGTGGLPGFAFMIRSELVDAVGGTLFDESYELWYGDNDLCLQMERLGATYGIVRDATVTHLDGGGRTSTVDGVNLKPEYVEMAARDRERFVKKWGQG